MRQLPFEYAFRNLGRSGSRLLAALIGSSLVALLALAAGGFVRGMQLTLTQHHGPNENVILLGTGSEEALERSQIDASVATIAAASIPGIRERGGTPFVSPEIHVALPVREAEEAEERQAVLRGVTTAALLVHPEVEIVEGRPPSAGADEIMVGALAATRLGLADERLAIGRTLHLAGRDWAIVGRFTAPATVMDAEIWVPLTDLQIATKRDGSISCVVLTLGDAAYDDVELFAKSRLDLELTAISERDYYASIAAFYRPIRVMVIATAALIGAGGLLGGLNTMYAAFASRVREVGALQAIGFSRRAIVVSLVQESLLASAAGTLLAVALALLLLDGLTVSFSMGVFGLRIDPMVLTIGLGVGLALGLIGALPPAARCLRLPITDALKAA